MGAILTMGSGGVVLLMGIESACIPLPSEIIMPFAGYMVFKHPERFSLIGVSVAGALGCVLGSVAAYYAGLYGGRPFVERYGKYVLMRKRDLDKADHWFAKYGNAAVFISRLLPVIRTFISFPAGIARVRMSTFIFYTFIGSLPWCFALAYIGKVLGPKWDTLGKYFHGADAVIGVIILISLALFIYHHVKPEKKIE
jgi:membrane protein DedA with SNARE-associated domain